MAFNTRISNVGSIAMLDALLALLNVTAAGTIEIRDGAIPANCIDADVGTLLATLTFSATSFQGATDANPGATANANSITGESSATAGTAQYFRCKSNAGVVIIQGEVSTAGADMNLDSVTIATGDTVNLSDWDVALPEA